MHRASISLECEGYSMCWQCRDEAKRRAEHLLRSHAFGTYLIVPQVLSTHDLDFFGREQKKQKTSPRVSSTI